MEKCLLSSSELCNAYTLAKSEFIDGYPFDFQMALNMQSSDLQLDWLRAFVAVVNTGSLTAAARQVNRSQSAVSMQMKKLEEEVGQSLLLRGPRHMLLTAAGTELLDHARKMLDIHTQALVAMRGHEVTGRVSLGVPDDYAMPYLTPVLRIFSGSYAGVEVTLVCEQSTALIPKVERGEIDIAVVTRDRPDRGILLGRERLVWVGDDRYEAWRRNPLPIAVHELGSQARAAVLAAISAERRAYRIVYSSPSVAGQLTAAHSGMAVAVLTHSSLPGNLKALDSRHGLPALPEMEIALIRSKQAEQSPAAIAMHAQILRTLRGAEG
jgi:DNA-binding transcriptional LysR family regulator